MRRNKKEEQARIVLIGPVYPYKGGIAHYTSLLYRELRQRFRVRLLSYKMQYPKILYKKEQKDYDNDLFRIPDAEFNINTANPVNWAATARYIRGLRPELVVIEWWHPYFSPCYWTICKLLRGIKIMFICHNVFPHERFLLDRILTKIVLKQGDYFVVHSSQDERDLAGIRPSAVCYRTVHPTYNAFRVQNMTKEEARGRLGLLTDMPVLLFFGFVRPYKGLKYLLRAMPGILKRIDNAKLLVVGDFAGDKETYTDIIKEEGISEKVEIHDGYIPDREVEKFFAACDVVVLPYESATQSGIAQIAYGFEKPVIATDVGGLSDVVVPGRTGRLVPPRDADALADAVIGFFEDGEASMFHSEIQREAERYSWKRLVSVIVELAGLS